MLGGVAVDLNFRDGWSSRECKQTDGSRYVMVQLSGAAAASAVCTSSDLYLQNIVYSELGVGAGLTEDCS